TVRKLIENLSHLREELVGIADEYVDLALAELKVGSNRGQDLDNLGNEVNSRSEILGGRFDLGLGCGLPVLSLFRQSVHEPVQVFEECLDRWIADAVVETD